MQQISFIACIYFQPARFCGSIFSCNLNSSVLYFIASLPEWVFLFNFHHDIFAQVALTYKGLVPQFEPKISSLRWGTSDGVR